MRGWQSNSMFGSVPFSTIYSVLGWLRRPNGNSCTLWEDSGGVCRALHPSVHWSVPEIYCKTRSRSSTLGRSIYPFIKKKLQVIPWVAVGCKVAFTLEMALRMQILQGQGLEIEKCAG